MTVICPFTNRKCTDCEYYKPTPGELHSYACFYELEAFVAKPPIALPKTQNQKNRKMEYLEVGDTVWTLLSNDIVLATVIEKYPDHVRVSAPCYDNQDCGLDQVFLTKEGCLEFAKSQSEDIISDYKQQISSINDLIQFMYNQNVARLNKWTNWEACEAARQRAKELLGVELKDD